MSKELVPYLQQVRDLIQTGWCSRTLARDANDCVCEPDADVAVRWCLAGAITRVVQRDLSLRRAIEDAFVETVAKDAPTMARASLWAYNDCAPKGQLDVLDMIDRTIVSHSQ